jgi:hypothetical protein
MDFVVIVRRIGARILPDPIEAGGEHENGK